MASPASSPQDPLCLLESFLDTETTNTAASIKKADSRARSDSVSPLLSSATGVLEGSDLAVRTRNSRVCEPEAGSSTMSQMDVDADFSASSPEVGRAKTTDSDAQMLHCSIRPRTLPGGDLSKWPPPQLLTLEEFDALEASSSHQPSVKHQLAWNTEPVPLPTRPSNPHAIPRFNHLCQVHSLTSSFSFDELQKGSFSSKIRFGEYTCEALGPFSNKRLAKEAVAESALGILESFQIPSKAEKGRPRKRTLTDRDASPSSDEKDENWVAILHEFVQKHHHSPPQFQYTQHNTYREQKMGLATGSYQYSCNLTLDVRPDYAFGSETKHYPSKAEAKRLAARDAVIWLRTVGNLQDKADETSMTRRKSVPDEVQTGLTHKYLHVSTQQSPAQLVASLSLGLKLSPPQFDLEPVENNFYVCTARYLDQDVRKVPELEGSLCRTPRTYGQKSAKSLCCQDLVILLGSLAASRDETQ